MIATPTRHTHEVLARVEANLKAVRRAEFERLQLAREWALTHLVTDPAQLRDPRRRPTPLGAVGLPVDEYAAAEFAAALELHPLAGRRGRRTPWISRSGCRRPGPRWQRGERDCPQAVADAIRAAGPAKVRPSAVVYLHLRPGTLLGAGVARAEDLGAITRQQLIDLLGHHQISLRPVIDLNDGMAADCYEVPAAIDERLQLIKPSDVFPFASSTSRRLDRDHTVPYDEHGPPAQTTEPNLDEMTRHHHRIKTHGGWTVTQQDGRFTWISPHGRVFATDGKGTHRPSIGWSGARHIDIVWSLAA